MKKAIITSILLALFTIGTHAQDKKEDYQKAFLELVKSADNDFIDILGEKGYVGETETRYACKLFFFGKTGYFVKDAEGVHYRMEITYKSVARKLAKFIDGYVKDSLSSPMYRKTINPVRTEVFWASDETQGTMKRYLMYRILTDWTSGIKTIELCVYGKSIQLVTDPDAYTGRNITREQLEKDIAAARKEQEAQDAGKKTKPGMSKEDMDKIVNSNSQTQSQQTEAARHQQEMDKQTRDTEKLKNGTWNGH